LEIPSFRPSKARESLERIMRKGKRDYRAEYRRRIARGAAKGVSRSQARGHPKPKETSVSSKRPPKPIEDDRLQIAFRVLRQEKSLAAAARAAKIAPERLRHYATERDIIERRGRRWTVRPQLPRRMLLFSNGRAVEVIVGDFASASKVGRFMSAVSQFLRTNNPTELREFEGASVADVSGKIHVFETRPNALYRLASAHDQSFEHIYRIIV
jgi:hypothetical protein